MRKKIALLTIVLLSALSMILRSQLATSTNGSNLHLTSRESEVIGRINGTNAYNYDLELEKIALNHNLSGYSFRSAGSVGANETAKLVKERLESFGLETHMEEFEFTSWNLMTQPVLIIDDDGNQSTTNDQVIIRSFQPEHYSWPTPEEGVFADLVVLPLPEAKSRGTVGVRPYDAAAWNAINTTGKILLIGREVRWTAKLHQVYWNKLKTQPPAAVIHTWWYDWMSWAPPMFASIGGRPVYRFGPYYWDLNIPVGWVNYEDGLWIRNREASENVSARMTINAVIGSGPHYNIVGRLAGSVNPEKTIIISGHYDTVVDAGFCDNGAGTAGVIELARVFSESAREGLYKPEYTLLFIAFTAEELGLIGAVKYMEQHKAELKNIIAVINLDCMGSDILEISETFVDDNGLNLKETVLEASEDLGVKVKLTDPGGSDQEAFRNPRQTDDEYFLFWGSRTNIGNATRVKSSIMIGSYPLFYSDLWENGTAGWIHTPYDNSSSTEALNWVEINHLESHIQVAALVVLRVLYMMSNPLLMQVYSVAAVAGAIAAVVVCLERSRVRVLIKRAYDSILFYIEMREFVYIMILTAILLFMSLTIYMRIGKAEVIAKGYPITATVQYFGTPFNMLGIASPSVGRAGGDVEEAVMQFTQSYAGNTIIIWEGLFLDIALYFSLAFIITYTITRINYRLKHVRVRTVR